MQNELNGPGLDRSTALVSRTLSQRPPSPISQARLERLLRDDQTDELMENVIELYEQVVQQAYRDGSALDLVVVEGVVPTQHTTYATQTNVQLAHALNARIILVGSGDLQQAPGAGGRAGYARSKLWRRQLQPHLGRHSDAHENLPYGQEDDLSAAPGTIKPQLEEPVLNELRRYSPALATDRFHLIGVVPYSKTLSAPRTLDVARALNAKMLNEGEAASRRVLYQPVCQKCGQCAAYLHAG